jgi:hypothetical protein
VGLEPAKLTVTATVKGKPYAVLIGVTEGDDTFVKTPDSPTVYSLKKYLVERIAHRPVDYRDKTVVKAKEADLAEIDIQKGADTVVLVREGEKWKLKAGGGDEAKLKPVATAFENLEGSSFAEEKDPQKTGLAKPTGTVTVVKKDKTRTVLKIGAVAKDDYFLQRVGSPDVLLVKKYSVDRFLKTPSDLGGTATAKK